VGQPGELLRGIPGHDVRVRAGDRLQPRTLDPASPRRSQRSSRLARLTPAGPPRAPPPRAPGPRRAGAWRDSVLPPVSAWPRGDPSSPTPIVVQSGVGGLVAAWRDCDCARGAVERREGVVADDHSSQTAAVRGADHEQIGALMLSEAMQPSPPRPVQADHGAALQAVVLATVGEQKVGVLGLPAGAGGSPQGAGAVHVGQHQPAGGRRQLLANAIASRPPPRPSTPTRTLSNMAASLLEPASTVWRWRRLVIRDRPWCAARHAS
jgi:hypothetical protein